MESTTVIKALGLLESLAFSGRDKTLAELAGELRMPKPTVHRLLKTLSATGYVDRGTAGIYRAGPALDRLSQRGGDDEVRAAATVAIRALHEATRETVNVGVLRRGEIVYLEVLESPQPLRRVVTANSIDPFYCTALGRAIAAQLSPPQVDHLFATVKLQKRTAETVVDPAALRSLLAEARRAGCAVERDQTDIGVTCLAAPFFDDGGVRGAISLSVPSPRIDELLLSKWLQQVRRAATEITTALRTTPLRTTPASESARSKSK